MTLEIDVAHRLKRPVAGRLGCFGTDGLTRGANLNFCRGWLGPKGLADLFDLAYFLVKTGFPDLRRFCYNFVCRKVQSQERLFHDEE